MPRVPILAALLLAAPLAAQMDWVRFPTNTGPATPVDRMAWFERCGCLISYGGYVTSEMWSWDGSSWALLDASAPPGARWGHGMSVDSRRGTLLVFGGGSGYYRNDTWSWDGTSWTQLQPARAPSGRFRMPMAYDARRDVHVLFGGEIPGNRSIDDTWEFDGTNWIPRSFAVRPPARLGHGLVFDPVRGEIVLFGGTPAPGSPTMDDTWTYDGTGWQRETPSQSPPSRSSGRLTWDEHRGVVVLAGGNSRPWNSGNVPMTDTWEWDGSDWTRRQTATSAPGPGQMVYDPLRRVSVLARGRQGETWFYYPRFAAQADPIGRGCASDGGRGPTPVVEAVDAPGNLPWLGATFTAAMRDVPAGGQPMLVFGVSRRQWGGTPLPIQLGPFGGAPGCTLAVSPDLMVPMPAHTSTQARLSFQIPNLTSWLGQEIFAQGLVVEAATSASELSTSNALRLQFGAR